MLTLFKYFTFIFIQGNTNIKNKIHARTFRYVSRAPFSMYSVTIMTCLSKKLKQKITLCKRKVYKQLMQMCCEWWFHFWFDFCLSSSTHIWWRLPPGGWCSGARTDPWCWPRSRTPVSVSLNNLVSGSWSLQAPLLVRESSSRPETLPQTLLITRQTAGGNVKYHALRFHLKEGRRF